MDTGPASGTGRAQEAHRRQTRRHLLFAAMWALIALGLLLGFGIAGSVSPGESPVWVFWLVGGGLALLFAIPAWAAFRRARPPALAVELRVEPADLRRGERLDVRVEPRDGVQVPEGVEVGLVCLEAYDVETTDGEGHTTRATREATEHEEWRALGAGGWGTTLAFEIPAEAPYSYAGDCLSYSWQVEARRPRSLRHDPRRITPIWVRP